MLINALCEYADLQSGSAVPENWSEQDVHYCIILSTDGELLEIVDIREKITVTDKKGKEKVTFKPVKCILPKRTQKSAIDSNYIEHRPLYIFGLNYDKESDSLTPDDKTNKARKSHEAFVEHELEFMEGLDSEICRAYRNFVEKWTPENETQNPALVNIRKELTSSYFCFSLGIGREKLEEDKQLKERFDLISAEKSTSDDAETAVCGILGKRLPQARLHDKIKFPGGQSSGCQLICMNDTAFESYGKTQSYNSNVSEEAMKKYTAVFNRLLADSKHHMMLDDMVIIFFAMKKNDEEECDLFSFFADKNSGEYSADGKTEQEISAVLGQAKEGYALSENVLCKVDENSTFYVAGFTPNSSRICQKFICRNHFGNIVGNLLKHQNDIRVRPDSKRTVRFRDIAKELISPKSTNDKVSPSLMTNIMLAAFNNTPYPDDLLATVVRRVKTDSDDDKNQFIKLNDTRIGIIKACLNRKYKKEEITMAWNENNNNPAYLCGGLFAVYEKIQKEASGGNLNRTIKDSYFSSACSRPAAVFPKLAKLANNHMSKFDSKGEVYYNIMIQEIADGLEGEFPQTLDLNDQGRFIVGYYQMNRKLYTSNKSE